jgi:hypothetical protein
MTETDVVPTDTREAECPSDWPEWLEAAVAALDDALAACPFVEETRVACPFIVEAAE